jgi:hypothetical protein
MKSIVIVLAAAVAVIAVAGAVGQSTSGSLPPGHPPVPNRADLLPGHPPLTTTAGPPSIEHAVAAYYESISGPAGAPREWDRFASLFTPQGRLITLMQGDAPVVLTPQQFAQMNRKYFEASGYSERPIFNRIDRFGRVAHVLSTYESRRGDDTEPYTRGVNSFQLFESQGRWWIVNVMWDRERPDAPIPPEYLPPDGG